MVTYYTDRATATPHQLVSQAIADLFVANGWTETPYGQFAKEFEAEHGVSKTTVRMRLQADPMDLATQGITPTTGIDPFFYCTRVGEIYHPHATGDGRRPCYHFHQTRGLHLLPPEGIAAMMVAIILKFPKTENPRSIAQNTWRICATCLRMDYGPRGRTCPTCGHFYCSEHMAERCRTCPAPLETPAGMEPWQHRAMRVQWPPCTPLLRSALIAGCGVTGSWVAPVLNRLVATVNGIDPDRLAHPALGTGPDYMNRGGLWNGNDRTKSNCIERQRDFAATPQERAYAAANLRHAIGGMDRTRRFAPRMALPEDLDLLVLCLDTASARLAARPRMAERILDVRATPRAVQFWSLPGRAHAEVRTRKGKGLWAVWKATLERQVPAEAQRCGDHHDAVPLVAGTVTARWVAAWMLAGMPIGYWSMPFAVEGLEAMPEPERVTPAPEETLEATETEDAENGQETVTPDQETDEEQPENDEEATGWVRQQISVRFAETTHLVPGSVKDGLGIHHRVQRDGQPERTFSVTHLASGLAVYSVFPTRERALRCAEWLLTLTDWRQDGATVARAAREAAEHPGPGLQTRIRQYAEGWQETREGVPA